MGDKLNILFRYTQCEAMSIHYKQPILLIEFDKNQSFTLQVFESFLIFIYTFILFFLFLILIALHTHV
jgi:hypothetical protein